MPPTLQQLEEADATVQRLIGLFTQADQDIERVLAIVSARDTHGVPAEAAARLHQALKDIQVSLHNLTDQHNQLVPMIDEAKSQAQPAATSVPDNPS